PVAILVGIGQGAARNQALDAHVVQLARLCAQARFDVAQTVSIGQLSERHAEVLVETRKALDLVRSAIARDATAKRGQRQMLRDLREHQFAQVHQCPLRVSSSQDRKSMWRSSNRDQEKPLVVYFKSTNWRSTTAQRPDSNDIKRLMKTYASTISPSRLERAQSKINLCCQ